MDPIRVPLPGRDWVQDITLFFVALKEIYPDNQPLYSACPDRTCIQRGPARRGGKRRLVCGSGVESVLWGGGC